MCAAMIRPAVRTDLPRLVEIYNHYVLNTPITFDIRPFTVESREAWFEEFAAQGRHRLWVAEEAGVVVGYAGTHRFRAKPAYDTSVETSVYLAPQACGRGLGAQLYGVLFAELGHEDIHTFIAGITLPNPASIALHERFGFKPCGVMHAVGLKFGSYWDVAWYERL
jgi:phosphinothricin acetyltransferase